jgi:hypothetical protein
VEILDERVSADFMLGDYMVELAVVCGQTGYSLEKFNPFKATDTGNYMVSISLSGIRDPAELTAAIESLERVTSIESMNISFGKSMYTINMSITVLSGQGL